tara:strand:- start:191 stop:592 length:402 start_codon:yes stop_codon:yes gene_type:complete
MIIKITPDKEKAESILRMCEHRETTMKHIRGVGFPTIIAENYYEIIKELITALLLIEGIKTIGEYAHKELIQKLLEYDAFKIDEIKIIDDLRIRRNKSSYEGKPFEKIYLENHEEQLIEIITKLKELVGKRLA